MKTKLMSLQDLPSTFKEHMSLFNSLDDKQIEGITNLLTKVDDIRDLRQDDKALIELSNNTNLSAAKFFPIMTSLLFSREMLNHHKDNPENFIDDLISEKILSEESARKYKTALLKIMEKPIVPDKDEYEIVLPVFRDVETQCLVLPKFEKEFNYKDKPEQYNSDISGIIPSVCVNIYTKGPKGRKNNYFILSARDLEDLMKELQLAKKQLEILQNSCKGIIKAK